MAQAICSPFKQHRIERHLSRQRGAGVRHLATSFGFSFALSAPPATAPPTTTAQSNPDSRTVLIPADGDEGAEDARPPNKRPPKGGRPKGPKSAKSKKAPIEVEVVAQDLRIDTEPEAPVRKQPRQARPEKVALGESEEFVARVDSAAPSRPRRRAATNAMSKVTQGFIEEEAPIDKKRRDPGPEQEVRRVRKKPAAAPDIVMHQSEEPAGDGLLLEEQSQPAMTAGQDAENIETIQGPRRPKTSAVQRRRKIETSGLQTNELSVQEPRRPKASATKRQRNVETTDSQENEVHAETFQEPRRFKASAAQRRREAETVGSQKNQMSAESSVPKAKQQNAGLDIDMSLPTMTQRKPLAETNANLTMRSVSPEKATKLPAEECGAMGQKPSIEPKIERTRKTAKGPVKRKAATMSSNLDGERRPELITKPTVARAKIDSTREPAPPKRKHIDRDDATPEIKTVAEDVDWLFDDVEQTRKKPRKARANVATKRVTRQALSKLPDLDLDDLLTDIASIAHKPGPRK